MVVRFPVHVKKAKSLRNVFVIALVYFVVFFPTKSSAQRAAVGIGSKLKGRFGMSIARVSRSGNAETTSQGEQEYDNDDRDGTLLVPLSMVAVEKPGIVGAMLAFICGYIYLFLQQSKIHKIEQAIAGGEFRILKERYQKWTSFIPFTFSNFLASYVSAHRKILKFCSQIGGVLFGMIGFSLSLLSLNLWLRTANRGKKDRSQGLHKGHRKNGSRIQWISDGIKSKKEKSEQPAPARW